MKISRYMAKSIITEINKIIPYKINIMDNEGVIIASTDEKRVGDKHMGACYLITHNLKELRIYENDEYEGGKPGINFPVIVQNRLIGVLGIRGCYEEIRPYAQIIKRMSEIMLQNEMYKLQQLQDLYRKNSYIYEWIHMDTSNYTHDFYEQGLLLGIDIYRKQRFMAIRPQIVNEGYFSNLKRYLNNQIYGNRYSFILSMASCILLAIDYKTDKELESYVHQLQANCDFSLYIGIDEDGESKNASIQFHQAKRALRCGRYKKEGIVFYNNILDDIIVNEVPAVIQKSFISKLFQGYGKAEQKEAIEVLECYYRHNGSIQKASAELYLHKNTLQHRLIKIKEKTGHDPRAMMDIPLFYLAIQFMQSLSLNEGVTDAILDKKIL